ncbi:acylneuraminate cytidylyltransferase family protein [Leptospira sp. FAT2]|uniref:acylneuraminate cytidylyltransferase family protein n=1 Tax=Leptospira sanjuanensis TaxID=2879643 RepID=UPI001EE8D8CB|nr:acylneuraminate cytidylyltransferase family protein [Leptospira sanjuanensis]MCG6167602.1 acylneuraminate cytidylyltransferase family protein [Leptospira sanjuanensis]MCG6193021.1 acylneuraminate cytidylyltransferase family protein [Leptospira sanjuanensis]
MLANQKVLAIVPARAGSKRIPNKNTVEIEKKPLIVWSLEAAKKSRYIDKIVISTDDPKIISIAKEIGIEIPFIRPKELSEDSTPTIDVLKHVIQFMRERGEVFDLIILLQPTSPLRTHEDIDAALEEMLSKSANSIISVNEMDHPVEWINTLPSDLSMVNFLKNKEKRSQEYLKQYRLNGAIYISKTLPLLEQNTFFQSEKTYAFIMEPDKSIDIDTPYDLKIASLLLKELHS